MDKSQDKDQVELAAQENAGLPPGYIQQYAYQAPPAMGYPYNPNEDKNYPVNPAYNPNQQVYDPNQQLAPNYIPPPVQAQNPPQTIVIQYGRQPMTMACPACHETMNTVIKRRPGLLIFLLVVLLVVVFWPAFFLPFFFVCWYDVYHKCGKCGTSLGSKKMIG